MISANNSDIADPIMRVVHDNVPGIGVPVIAMDNSTVEFVDAMPSGYSAPARISGVTYTTVPAVLFTHQPIMRFDPTSAGSRVVAEGYADFVVVAGRNGFANAANAIAAAIAGLFPMGKRIAITGGLAVVMEPAMPMAGYDDGVYWRVPTRIKYRAV